MKFAALLRGINVGKSVQVPMRRLKEIFEGLGFQNVITYLNSGNGIFESEKGPGEITALVEGALEGEFGQRIPTLILTAPEILKIRDGIPEDWVNDETQQTYAAYLFKDADYPELIQELPIKRQFMDIRYVPGALLWNIKREFYHKSQITKIASHPAYGKMTTRNVNTARKLAELCTGA